MTNDWEEAADFVEARFAARRRPAPLLTADAAALAAFVLTGVSLFLVGAGGTIASVAQIGIDSSIKVLAVIPGIQALIAVVGILLGRFALRTPEGPAWIGSVARASLVVGTVSIVVNLTAMGFALS